jgi:Transposase IS116/IS110/IS902 family
MSLSTNEATHPRCCDEGYPDGPGGASNKEVESWGIIARLSSESIRQNCGMRWQLPKAGVAARCGSLGSSLPRRQRCASSWPSLQRNTVMRPVRQDIGSTGSSSLGHECIVVAPSLIPKKPGDRVKTNRRDAASLAKRSRAGELTAVWVPDERHEATRDLSRARQAAKMDLQGKRQQISSLMLRLGRIYPGKKTWGPAHVNWLMAQKLEHREQRIAFEELLEGMRQEEERVQRLEEAIRDAVPEWSLAEVATALRAVRGIDLIAAVAVLAELGDLSRFRNPRELMGYVGLVPSESSTGDTVKRGGITKARNGGETHPCGSGVELSISTARESRETAKGGGCAQTRARDCLESASQTVRALPVARAEGQAANRNRHGDCTRANVLHLGDQSRDHGRSAGVTSPEAVDRSSRAALDRPTAPALQSRSNKTVNG